MISITEHAIYHNDRQTKWVELGDTTGRPKRNQGSAKTGSPTQRNAKATRNKHRKQHKEIENLV